MVIRAARKHHGVDRWVKVGVEGEGLASAEYVGLDSLQLLLIRTEIHLSWTLYMRDCHLLDLANLKAQATCETVGGAKASSLLRQ